MKYPRLSSSFAPTATSPTGQTRLTWRAWESLSVSGSARARRHENTRCAATARISQSRINRLALQRQHPEDALMDPAERLRADEPFQSFDAQGKLAQCQ